MNVKDDTKRMFICVLVHVCIIRQVTVAFYLNDELQEDMCHYG